MPVIQHQSRSVNGLHMALGANPRPRDPAEDKYRYTRLVRVAQYDLSQPYLLDLGLISDITDQKRLGACTSFTDMEGNYTLSRIDSQPGTLIHAGWLYEQVRKKEGSWPQDAGAWEADNLDIVMAQGAPLWSDAPYVDQSGQTYDQLTPNPANNFVLRHMPFAPSDGDPIQLVVDAIVNKRPVAIAMAWLSPFFNPVGGWLPDGSNPADVAGGHEILCRGYVPPRAGKSAGLVCANHWTVSWSADAPNAGFGLRPGDFIIPVSYANPALDVIWEFRALTAVAIQPQPDPNPQPEPNPQPVPGDWKTPALGVIDPAVKGLQDQFAAHPTSRTLRYEVKGAQAIRAAVQGA